MVNPFASTSSRVAASGRAAAFAPQAAARTHAINVSLIVFSSFPTFPADTFPYRMMTAMPRPRTTASTTPPRTSTVALYPFGTFAHRHAARFPSPANCVAANRSFKRCLLRHGFTLSFMRLNRSNGPRRMMTYPQRGIPRRGEDDAILPHPASHVPSWQSTF